MVRLLVALDPGAGVRPAQLAAAWNADAEASVVGVARVEATGGGEFLPGVLELIVVPLAVNVASSAVYDLVRRLATRLRPERDKGLCMEVAELTSSDDHVVVVRLGDRAS